MINNDLELLDNSYKGNDVLELEIIIVQQNDTIKELTSKLAALQMVNDGLMFGKKDDTVY